MKGLTMSADISFVRDRQATQNVVPAVEGESQELVGILQKIVQNAGALLGVSNCSVALLDTTGSTLVTLAALQKNGRKSRRTRFRLNEGVAGWVATHHQTLVINDVSLDSRFKRLGRIPVGAMICVPLMDGSNFIGTLTASSREVNVFDERKTQALTIFAEQAVLAIINARHAELARRQANQLELLMSLSRDITTRLEAEELYRTILAYVRRLVPCDLALLYLYYDGLLDLRPVAELQCPVDASPYEQEMCATIVKTANLQREKVGLYDTNSLTAWASIHRHPILRAPGTAPNQAEGRSVAELAAPLVSKNVLYGVITLERATPFTSEELRLVRNLSHLAAAALENGALFQKVRADQEQLRAILASSSDGIALLGVNACFIEVNPAFARLFGLEPEQIMGMECMELLGCQEEGGHTYCAELCMVHRALQLEQPLPYVELDLQIQGVARSVGLSITPVLTPAQPLCLMVARDVTAIREATRMKANFISMITHELRSPLNAINGYLDLVLTGVAGEISEQMREFVRRARSGSETLYGLIEDLLLISRADAGQWRLNREIISLQEIVEEAVEEMEVTASDQELTISVEGVEKVPQLYADQVRLQQVLRNLLSNALRFTPAGGRITIKADVVPNTFAEIDAEQPRVLLLSVSDTGYGIAPEFHQRIFERFYQVPGSVVGRKGQGLGLAIVKMIIELHGGKVLVESEPGKGSTFTCILPCLLS
jgi:PAS domain S-box-containing protein